MVVTTGSRQTGRAVPVCPDILILSYGRAFLAGAFICGGNSALRPTTIFRPFFGETPLPGLEWYKAQEVVQTRVK